jgi:hypothetical protein
MALGSIAVPILIFALACGVFYPSLPNGFAFDDHLAIEGNADTAPDSPWADIWRNDIWGKSLRAVDSHRSFRPLLAVTFKLLRMQFGLDPTAFRIFSIICHACSSVLVHCCALAVMGDAGLAAVAAALFAAHPVHVESVAAVVNLAEPLSCVFYLVAFLVYRWDVCRADAAARGASPPPPALLSLGAKLLWLGCVIVATLVKETGVTAGGVLAGDVAVCLLQRGAAGRAGREGVVPWRPWLRARVWWVAVAGVSLAWYAVLRVVIVKSDIVELAGAVGLVLTGSGGGGGGGGGAGAADRLQSALRLWGAALGGEAGDLYLGDSELIRRAENPFAFLDTRAEKVLSFMYLHFRYVYVLVWPAELSAEYAFDCIRKVSALWDPRNLGSLAAYGGVALAGLYEAGRLFCAARQANRPRRDRDRG